MEITLRYIAAMDGYLDMRIGSVDGLIHLFRTYPYEFHFCILICWLEGVIDAKGIQCLKRN